MIFLKLGGSLITDKTRENMPRPEVIARLAREIAAHLQERGKAEPLLIGHGSGSFGHAAARKYGTRDGVRADADWRGFAEVSVVAARLNRLVADALHDAGVPVVSAPPSASARCEDGRIVAMDTRLIRAALDHGLVPLVQGDVALDTARGGTIVSTEEVFAYLAGEFPVTHILLAGETEGVYGHAPEAPGDIIECITPQNWETLRGGVGGSRGADVTGGMASKVRDMLALVSARAGLTALIFSGLEEGNVARALRGELIGTLVRANP
jgi:isopentenyl phosphate kinase